MIWNVCVLDIIIHKRTQKHAPYQIFYIQEQNLIVEIKSSYTLDIQNMRDKFKAYKKLGYNCKYDQKENVNKLLY